MAFPFWVRINLICFWSEIGYLHRILSENGKPLAATSEWNFHFQIKYSYWECRMRGVHLCVHYIHLRHWPDPMGSWRVFYVCLDTLQQCDNEWLYKVKEEPFSFWNQRGSACYYACMSAYIRHVCTTESHKEDIIFSFLPFSKGDTRVILVFAANVCGILVFTADICGILKYATDICGILKRLRHTHSTGAYWQISPANSSMPPITVAYTSMTRVSPFENGRNEKIMSSG